MAAIALAPGCQKSEESAKSEATKGAKSKSAPKTEVTPAKSVPGKADPKAAALPKVPLGLPPVPVPADNPMTASKVELGKMLYFDTRLSKSNTISCATCHDPKMAWAEHTPTSKGIHGQVGDRNAPTVINAAYLAVQFWDGRAPSLEAQALGPIENPIEMGNKMELVVTDLAKVADYKKRFKDVFGTEVTKDGVAKAIAAFERTVLSGNSPYDKSKAGDVKALTDAQKKGMDLFMDRAMCSTCHAPPIFSNSQFHNAGVGCDKPKPDEGLMKVSGKASDKGKFRVPHLREVANTYPYFHDGSAPKLEDAVALMAGGGKDNPNLSPILKSLRSVKITPDEQKLLVEFLRALSGDYPKTAPPKLPK
jgi:cytochrome c peroxidase